MVSPIQSRTGVSNLTTSSSRIDLHPTTSDNSNEDPEHGPSLDVRVSGEQPPEMESTANETSRRNRRSRILSTLNIGRMRHATPQERIEALRTLRSEGMAGVERQEQGDQTGNDRTMRRLSRRFNRALGSSRPTSSTPPSRPVSDVPHAALEPQTSTVAEAPPSQETEAQAQPNQRRQEFPAG